MAHLVGRSGEVIKICDTRDSRVWRVCENFQDISRMVCISRCLQITCTTYVRVYLSMYMYVGMYVRVYFFTSTVFEFMYYMCFISRLDGGCKMRDRIGQLRWFDRVFWCSQLSFSKDVNRFFIPILSLFVRNLSCYFSYIACTCMMWKIIMEITSSSSLGS